jgi:O-antigen/teichoic acid export membrane protein
VVTAARTEPSEAVDFLARARTLLPRGYFDLAKVVTGNLARNLLRGILKLVVAGALTPQAFGILRSVYGLFRIVASLAELGFDHALVALGARAIRRNEVEREQLIFRTVLVAKLTLALALTIVGNLFAGAIAGAALGDRGLELAVRLVFLGLAGQLVWKYFSSALSARQRFGWLAAFLSTMPALMLASAGALIAAGAFDLDACLLIYLLAPTVTVVLWWPALRVKLAERPLVSWPVLGELVRFGRWIYVSNFASANRNHLNPVMLKNPQLSGSVEAGELAAGLYSFGADLASEITVFSQSLLSVLMPKASGIDSPERLRRFVRRSYLHLAWLLVVLAPLVFLAEPFLRLLGMIKESYLDYLPCLPIFTVLYLGNLLAVASIPMQTALYSMRVPHVETWIEVAGLVLLVVGGIMLIPAHGAIGAAYVILGQRLLAFTALVWIGTAHLRRWEGDSEARATDEEVAG